MHDLLYLSEITGFTDRTLRNYISLGLLKGNKQDGKWFFTDEDITDFITNPNVKPSLISKRNALIYDFMSEKNDVNRTLIVLRINADEEKAKNISDFFCEKMNHMKNADFSFSYEKGKVQVILKGEEKSVHEIMEEYYNM